MQEDYRCPRCHRQVRHKGRLGEEIPLDYFAYCPDCDEDFYEFELVNPDIIMDLITRLPKSRMPGIVE